VPGGPRRIFELPNWGVMFKRPRGRPHQIHGLFRGDGVHVVHGVVVGEQGARRLDRKAPETRRIRRQNVSLSFPEERAERSEVWHPWQGIASPGTEVRSQGMRRHDVVI